MNPEPRSTGTDRLRALNVPHRVQVELDQHGLPIAFRDGGGEAPRAVEVVGEVWYLDDEWWRAPIARRYIEVVLAGGGRVVLFEDRTTGAWFAQLPTPC